MKIKMIMMLLLVMMLGNGCCSYMVYQDSQQKVTTKKIRAMDEPDAVRAFKAVRLGGDGIGIGVDLASWKEIVTEQKLKQFAAAFGDALMLWGGTEAYRAIEDAGSSNDKRGHGNITINGNHNTIIIEGSDNDSNSDYEEKID